MSRLDIITIVIVGVCVAALGYLLYMTISQINTPPEEAATVAPLEPIDEGFTYEDSTYAAINPSEDPVSGNQPQSYQDAEPDRIPETSTSQSTPDEAEIERPEPATSTSTRPTTTTTTKAAPRSDRTGKYLVIAGSFRNPDGAERRVRDLRELGYQNAEASTFDRGLTVALVDRFSSRSSADALVRELQNRGVDAFVKIKQ